MHSSMSARGSSETTTPLSSPSSPTSTASSSSSSTPNEILDALEAKQIRKELKQNKAQLERSQLQIKRYEKEIAFYKALETQENDGKNNGKSQETIRELEVELKATVRSLAKAHAELVKKEATGEEIDSLNKRILELQNECDHMRKGRDAKEFELQELHSMREALEEEINGNKQQQQETDASYSAQETIIPSNGNNRSLEIENLAMKEEIEKMRDQLEKSQFDVQKTLQGQHEAEIRLEDAQNQLMAMRDKVAELKKLERRQDMVGVENSSSSKATESEVTGLHAQIERLTAENDALKL